MYLTHHLSTCRQEKSRKAAARVNSLKPHYKIKGTSAFYNTGLVNLTQG